MTRPEPTRSRGAETRHYGRAASLLSAGIALGGLLIYAFFAVASHNLLPDEYGRLVVLWLAVVVIVSILFRPIEQLLARTVAEARARGAGDGHPIRVAATIAATLAFAFVAVAIAGRGPIEDGLLAGDTTLYWTFLAAVIVYGVDFFVRGVVAGRGQFHLYATLLIAYGLTFIGFAAAAALGAGGLHLLALGVAASPLAGLAIVIAAITAGRRRRTGSDEERGRYGRGSIRAAIAGSSGFAAAVLVVMLSEQMLVNAGPLIARATADVATAGFVFNLVMVARAPIALFQGIAASLLPHLARLRSRGGAEDLRAFTDSVRATLRAVCAFGVLAGALMATAGPALMQIAFGDSFDYGRGELLVVVAGMTAFLCAATLNQSALARGQAPAVAVAWGLAALSFAGFNALPVLEPELRVVAGLAGAALLLAAYLHGLYRRGDPRPDEGLEPGSPQELQARLAAAEEGG